MEGALTAGGDPLRRVLVACRGELAPRLIRLYRAMGLETVAAFSIAEADAAWVGEADYDAYLGDGDPEAVWADPSRLVSAAMDAGCEALHPGYGRAADALDLYAAAASANVAVLGSDPRRVADFLDRTKLVQAARRAGIPVLPATDPLPPGSDGIEEAARIGLPLYVRAVSGPWLTRVDSFDELPGALAAIRAADPSVLLEKAADRGRRVGTVIAGDSQGTTVHLGELVGSEPGTEMGPEAFPGELHRRLGEWAVRLARESRFVGVGRVRWLVTADGRPWLMGFNPRLPLGFDLCEAVQGIDLLHAQHAASVGEELADWSQTDATALTRHGLQLRVRHDGEPGTIEALELPPSSALVRATSGWTVGEPVLHGSDRVLAKVTVLGDSRESCRARMREALGRVRIVGVGHDLDALIRRLGG